MASPADTTMTSRYASRQLNKLCDGCQAVFPTEGPWFWDREGARTTDQGEWILRDFTVRDLHESAEAGCHLCRVFLDSLLPPDMIVARRQGYHEWYDANKDIQLRCTLEREWGSKLFPMELKVLASDESNHALGERFEILAAQPLRFRPVRLLQPEQNSDRTTTWVTDLGFDTWRDRSLSGRPFTIVQPSSATSFNASAFAQVRRWLTACLEGHDCCSNWRSILVDPYIYQHKIRFIDVGTVEEPIFRLVDGQSLVNGTAGIQYVTPRTAGIQYVTPRTAGIQYVTPRTAGIQYVTLSYRWTAETDVTSMKSYNKVSYQDSIPTDRLPQVYKDAAAVARALGVRYVWIDSLCIIQDSPEDWNEQSSMMDEIYTYGLLNLSAMFADRALGLHIERDPLAVSPCILSRRLPTRPEKDEESHEHWICFEGYGANSFVDLAPLFKRAWCHQERVLPIRTVYFGEQLIWQCQKHMASESFPSWIWRGPYDPFVEMSVHAQRQHAFDTRYPLANDPREALENIVKFYTQTQATKQTDRLVALRGIFNRFGEMWDQQDPDWCVAGLWKQHLVRQLLWERCGEMDRADEEMTAHAKEILNLFPSWSWASCPSEIFFQTMGLGSGHHVEDLVELESIQPSRPLKPGDTYTAFETGSRIVLRGSIGIQVDTEKVLQTWATQESLYGFDVSLSIDGERTLKFETGIVFDRPLIDSIKHENLRLLPLRMYCLINDTCSGYVGGLLVESLGIRDGLPAYRRMGLFSAFCEKEIIPGWVDRVEELAENIDATMEGLRDKRKEFPLVQLV